MNTVKSVLAPAFVALLLAFQPAAWAQENWYPSRYGAGDTIGAANNLSAETVLAATRLVSTGKVYSLAIDTGSRTPRIRERDYKVVVVERKPTGSNLITGHDDLAIAWQGVGTQIDGLGHVGINGVYYNGFPGDEVYASDGLKKLSVHTIPPIVSRGILLDMAAYYGVDMVAEGIVFNRKEIDAAAHRQGLEIRKGDVVLFHTGWLDLLPANPERFVAGNPGIGKEGARYLAEKGVVAVGSDTMAGEANPPETEGEFAPVHQILLTQNGVYILEYIDSRELVADQVYEFLFVLGQPRLEGAVQAIVNPIAIR